MVSGQGAGIHKLFSYNGHLTQLYRGSVTLPSVLLVQADSTHKAFLKYRMTQTFSTAFCVILHVRKAMYIGSLATNRPVMGRPHNLCKLMPYIDLVVMQPQCFVLPCTSCRTDLLHPKCRVGGQGGPICVLALYCSSRGTDWQLRLSCIMLQAP